MDDIRRKIISRQIILDIEDYTNIEFSDKDLEWIAENIECLLQQNYDIKVENIEVKEK